MPRQFDLSSTIHQNLYDSSEFVEELEPDDFIRNPRSNLIELNLRKAKGKYGFIMFYSSTCPHCINMVETWDNLARLLDGDVFIGAFNCTNDSNGFYRTISRLANIQYYPTIKFLKPNGMMIPYNHGRSKEDLLRFLCNQTSKFCQPK